MSVVILFYMIVYLISALIFVFIVRKITKLGIIRWLAVAFVIFLPTWDVVLGYLVYYPACAFIPKIAIYETAETDSIYFEGINNDVYGSELKYDDDIEQIEKVGGLYFHKWQDGFKYLEAKVFKRCNDAHACDMGNTTEIKPTIYKCTPLSKNNPNYTPTRCLPTEKVESPYMVEVKTIKIGITEINFKKIYRRTNGKLMAEYNRVSRWGYAGLLDVPFFEWLNWRWWSESRGSNHCPMPDERYFTFEYEVLIPIKR